MTGTPTATRADLQRRGDLPHPARERWQPLRVGLLDLFHYDYQEFWFRDGRVLWRGNNGTGKSKVLALTLPFLLDGEIAAHRVEPDGDRHKRMEWNLLLGGRYPERLGYTWIEFGRRSADGQEHFVTAGIALKAVAGRGVADRWYFVTDRRVGSDLPLVTASGIALSHDRLVDALGDRGAVVRRAKRYRELIDERLFQLGADRYEALIDLLVQLRQPQLSKAPDPVLLSQALSEALAPLDEGLLTDAAAGFHDLELQRDELHALVDTREHLTRFVRRYTGYAAVAARRQARELRAAHSRYEEAGRRLGELRESAERAGQAQEEAAAALAEARGRRMELQAEREQLREDPQLRRLDRTREAAQAAHDRAEAAGRRVASARATQARADAEVRRIAARADAAAAERDRAWVDLAAVAEQAASGPAHRHALEQAGEPADPARLRRALNQVADERGAALQAVRQLAAALAGATQQAARAGERLTALEADRDAAADAVTDADEAVMLEGDRLVTAWRSFALRVDSVPVPYPDEVGLPAWVAALDGPDPASAVLDDRVQAVRADLARADGAARARLSEVDERLAALADRRAELEAGLPPTPDPSPTRDESGRVGRPGAPLWRVVETRPAGDSPFEPDEAQWGGLEAALQAAGLLDAWVTPEGRLAEPDRLDAQLLPIAAGREPDEGEHTLADLLRPSIDKDDPAAAALSEAAVTAVLKAIPVQDGPVPDGPVPDGLRTGASDGPMVSFDGSFRLGPLRGRWLKPAAEFIGAAARERSRRARLAELAAQTESVGHDRETIVAELAGLAAHGSRLTEQLRERPADQSLRDAHARAAAARSQLAERESRLPAARETVRSTTAAAEATGHELATTAADLGLPVDVEGHEAIALALARYRAGAGEVVAAVQRHGDLAFDVHHRIEERDATVTALVEASDEQTRADDESRAARATLLTLESSIGADVAQLRERLTRTVTELSELDAAQDELERRHTRAVTEVGVIQGRQQELQEEQVERQVVRDRSVRDWQAFAATGLLRVAAPAVEPLPVDGEWAPEPAVRLARRAEAELSGTDDGDEAWGRVQEDITRRFTELGEALTRHGHHAHGNLTEGLLVVSILYAGRDRAPGELVDLLSEEVELRERELTGRERQVLEDHLVGDVASRLQELITEADEMVSWMNAELAERPTSTGMRLRLVWQPDPDGPEGLAQARSHLLRQTSQLWSESDRAAVRDFLQRQIQRMRSDDPQGTWTDHLRRALDYRGWHRFVIERLQDGAWRSATGPASGGERVLTVSLPLFAAASAHYRSAHPLAPRLVMLDEAFAGVDDDARAKCLGLLTEFDLDVAMTSEREWGFYATVPGIATYQLVRHDGVDAVHVTTWEWDGRQPRQVDRPTELPIAPATPTDRSEPDPGGSLF